MSRIFFMGMIIALGGEILGNGLGPKGGIHRYDCAPEGACDAHVHLAANADEVARARDGECATGHAARVWVKRFIVFPLYPASCPLYPSSPISPARRR